MTNDFEAGVKYALEYLEEVYGPGLRDTDIWQEFFPEEED